MFNLIIANLITFITLCHHAIHIEDGDEEEDDGDDNKDDDKLLDDLLQGFDTDDDDGDEDGDDPPESDKEGGGLALVSAEDTQWVYGYNDESEDEQ